MCFSFSVKTVLRGNTSKINLVVRLFNVFRRKVWRKFVFPIEMSWRIVTIYFKFKRLSFFPDRIILQNRIDTHFFWHYSLQDPVRKKVLVAHCKNASFLRRLLSLCGVSELSPNSKAVFETLLLSYTFSREKVPILNRHILLYKLRSVD